MWGQQEVREAFSNIVMSTHAYVHKQQYQVGFRFSTTFQNVVGARKYGALTTKTKTMDVCGSNALGTVSEHTRPTVGFGEDCKDLEQTHTKPRLASCDFYHFYCQLGWKSQSNYTNTHTQNLSFNN